MNIDRVFKIQQQYSSTDCDSHFIHDESSVEDNIHPKQETDEVNTKSH